MTHVCLRALMAALFLLFALPAPAAAADEQSSGVPVSAGAPAVDFGPARDLIRAGRFEEALAILANLLKSHPTHPNAKFLYSLAAVEASQAAGADEERREALLDEAIAHLRAMLVDEPGLVRVRLELARAFFLLEEYDLARQHFEQVLAGEPPAPVVVNVRRFLSEIRARRRWSLYLGGALAPDTNIGNTSKERTIFVPIFVDEEGRPLPFRLNTRRQSGVGVWVWGGGEYQYPLGDRLRLRSGGSFSRRDYKNSDFDQMTVSAHIGPRWLLGQVTEASLLGSVHRHWASDVPSYDDLGARVEAERRLSRRVRMGAEIAWHDRQYRHRTNLDGPITDAALRGSWIVTPIVQTHAAIGLRNERPRRKRDRNRGHWLRAGVSVALPLGFTVGGTAQLRWTKYEGSFVFFNAPGESRKDRTRSLRLSVFNRAFTIQGFSPQISVVHEVRKSNARTLDYKSTGGELRFVRQF